MRPRTSKFFRSGWLQSARSFCETSWGSLIKSFIWCQGLYSCWDDQLASHSGTAPPEKVLIHLRFQVSPLLPCVALSGTALACSQGEAQD